jgi:hypothetical protein
MEQEENDFLGYWTNICKWLSIQGILAISHQRSEHPMFPSVWREGTVPLKTLGQWTWLLKTLSGFEYRICSIFGDFSI